MAASNFKVIVVGGGPVGLTAAHALEKAGIDFTLLESRPHVVFDAGSDLVMSPIGLRALAQLGLYDALKAVSSKLGRIDRLDHQGRNIGDLSIFLELEKNFGTAPRAISRHDLTQVLYDSLSPTSHSRILPNMKLSGLETTAEGVIATCTDGSTHHGSLVIGADGAHSMVRKLMRGLAIESGSTEVNEEQPFTTTYRCLWLRFPRDKDLAEGTSCEAHGPKLATQLFAGEDTTVVGVYERLDAATKERQHYTTADQNALIDRWGHITVVPSGKQTLRDVFEDRLESGLVSLEEGTVQHWSHAGRIVLVGDAAHKYTPSTGAGCNAGIIDIVTLANELTQVIGSPESIVDGEVSSDAIATALQAYQAARQKVVTAEGLVSGNATAMATWQSGTFKFLDQYVIPYHVLQRFVIRRGAEKAVKSPAFSYIKREEPFVGTVPWVRAAL